jgi:hypothetical protein
MHPDRRKPPRPVPALTRGLSVYQFPGRSTEDSRRSPDIARNYIEADRHLFDYDPIRVAPLDGLFRGPAVDTDGDFGVFLGAGQTFGRFAERPFVTLVAERLGMPCLNLGQGGAGPARYNSGEMLAVINRARFCVVQVMSGRSTSNDFFDAQTGRNAFGLTKGQRGPAAFAKEIIAHVLASGDDRLIRRLLHEMRRAWVEEMHWLARRITVPKLLFYISHRDAAYTADPVRQESFNGGFPQFIDLATLDTVAPGFDGVAECVSDRGLPNAVIRDGRAVPLTVGRRKVPRNTYYPSPEMHEDAAAVLAPAISGMLAGRRPRMLFSSRPLVRPARTEADIRPNFLIIGAAKAGTSALVSQMRRHPDVFIPPAKEIRFFIPEIERSAEAMRRAVPRSTRTWDRYLEFFRGGQGVAARGEATVAYSLYPLNPGVPAMIAERLPDVRLVYLVRDPLARIVSQYRHAVRDGKVTEPFEEWLYSDLVQESAILRSNYKLQLDQYLVHFDRSVIHIEFHEDFQKDHRATLSRVFGFLGIDPEVAAAIRSQPVNVTSAGQVPYPEISAAMREDLRTRLKQDSGDFLEAHGKPRDFWPSMA